MLVLTRKLNEQILIGDDISLTVVDIKNNRVRIGINAPAGVEIIRAEILTKNPNHPRHRQGDPRILIVDDSPEDRQLVRRFMARSTPHCLFSETDMGEQGLEMCRQQPPDCVLLDYQLPDLDGLEFLQKLRGDVRGRTIPVIVFTGQGDEKIAVEAMKKGAQDYLVKQDISPEKLQRAIYQAIHVPVAN